MIFATIRADATVASEMDCFWGSTVFTLVCEEAANLVLAGQHRVDFSDFDIAEVIFFREAKSRPVNFSFFIPESGGFGDGYARI